MYHEVLVIARNWIPPGATSLCRQQQMPVRQMGDGSRRQSNIPHLNSLIKIVASKNVFAMSCWVFRQIMGEEPRIGNGSLMMGPEYSEATIVWRRHRQVSAAIQGFIAAVWNTPCLFFNLYTF